MSENVFEGACKGPNNEEYDTTVSSAACGGLLVIQDARDSSGEDQVLLSDEACEAIAKYIRGDE